MSSQWYGDLEFVIWDRLDQGESRLGNLLLTPELLAELTSLSEAAGGWFSFSDEAEENTGEGLVFVDAGAWKQAYAEWLDRVPPENRPRDR
jgi:hypothetical protein